MAKSIFFLSLLFFNFFRCLGQTTSLSDTSSIKKDLVAITKTVQSRNFRNLGTLNSVAEYIFQQLQKSCDTVYYQTYRVDGKEYKNVVGSIAIDKQERVIIGAHYDVAGEQEGADDNASGVAGILELARLLSGKSLSYRIDFVAYTLEEPPYFRTQQMGSYVHAASLREDSIDVKGMICLEMIGYFDEAAGSQRYPVGFFKLFYGGRGNYITVVQKNGNGRFGRKVKKLMKKDSQIPVRSLKAPSFIPGIDFSDHLNYWKFGYSAVMITDTAFYRNKNYHRPSDTLETLNIEKMALVIDQVYSTLISLK